MSEMIERVARALDPEAWKEADAPLRLGRARDPNPCLERILASTDAARRVIAAMREPGDALRRFETREGNLVDWDADCYYCGGHKFAWQAIIDAALKPD